MDTVFLHVMNMSITASWLVLAVVIARLVLKKAPKALRVVMWAFVGIRLVVPFSVESMLSLVPSVETIPSDILYSDTPMIQSGIPILNETVNPMISDVLAPTPWETANPMQIITGIASYVWIAGMILMVLYTVVSYLNIYRKVREAVPLVDNVWQCDRIASPFILGMIRPRIYLPSEMGEQDMGYVVAHEKAHLKRRDHWWKPLGFLLLTVYWFNPILWIAYVLLCRDIELACDEKVIREMGTESKKPYSDALINCSVPRRMIAACPLAFGEVGVKARIKSVLNYRKPGFWIILAAVVVSAAVVICFLTDPPANREEQQGTESTDGGSMGSQIQIPDGPVRYEFKDSVDPVNPSIILNFDNGKTFSFGYSAFSSYFAYGNYEVVNGSLILRTGDGKYTYVFDLGEDKLIFDASRSSKIPEYRYSGDSDETECPVPDGAVFERVVITEPADAQKIPPELTLYGAWRSSAQATMGIYDWTYDNGDGTFGTTIACGTNLVELADQLSVLVIQYSPLSSISPDTVGLHFEVMPDEFVVLAWELDGEEPVSQMVEMNGTQMQLVPGADVYEVVATWDKTDGCGGEVRYGFRVTYPYSEDIANLPIYQGKEK